jgi:mono/diheme cytochrome c family protein|tara:strand:- start:67 stop:510 length:444 start_codon:yes stop_codon:yes gene_type:complete
MNISKWAAFISLFSLLIACGETEQQTSFSDTGRWYTEQQLDNGAQIFGTNCAVCHGDQAQGLAVDWQSRQDDGAFPPPPLNGSAHAWHHPVSVLLGVIEAGGEDLGGKMPAFESVLNHDEKMATIAYFQSFWSDDIYLDWEDMGGEN